MAISAMNTAISDDPYKKALEVLAELKQKQLEVNHRRAQPTLAQRQPGQFMFIDPETQLDLEIYHALEKALTTGPWEESNFLRATGKKLQELRDRCRNELYLEDALEFHAGKNTTLSDRIVKRGGMVEVFLYLYVANGVDIERWQSVLTTITAYSLNRPIYANEADAKAALRAATNIQNEAYVSVYVRAEEILTQAPEAAPRDRLGCELVVVREKSIFPAHITRFMHVSGQYVLDKGCLVRQSAAEIL